MIALLSTTEADDSRVRESEKNRQPTTSGGEITSGQGSRQLNTRLDEVTYTKFKQLAKRLGGNEEAMRFLLNAQEQAPPDIASSKPPVEDDEFAPLRRRLAVSSDRQLIATLKKRLESAEARNMAEGFVNQQFLKVTVAFAKPLFSCARKIQDELKLQRLDSHISTIVNLSLLHLIVHSENWESGELEVLRAYARFGPTGVNPSIFRRFMETDFTFNESQSQEEEEEDR